MATTTATLALAQVEAGSLQLCSNEFTQKSNVNGHIGGSSSLVSTLLVAVLGAFLGATLSSLIPVVIGRSLTVEEEEEERERREELVRILTKIQDTLNDRAFVEGLQRSLDRGGNDCESFARRTFTTPQNSDIYHPQIRTFPTPKKKDLPGGQLPPPFFFSFFLAHFSWLFRLTAHGGHQGWEGGGA